MNKLIRKYEKILDSIADKIELPIYLLTPFLILFCLLGLFGVIK